MTYEKRAKVTKIGALVVGALYAFVIVCAFTVNPNKAQKSTCAAMCSELGASALASRENVFNPRNKGGTCTCSRTFKLNVQGDLTSETTKVTK